MNNTHTHPYEPHITRYPPSTPIRSPWLRLSSGLTDFYGKGMRFISHDWESGARQVLTTLNDLVMSGRGLSTPSLLFPFSIVSSKPSILLTYTWVWGKGLDAPFLVGEIGCTFFGRREALLGGGVARVTGGSLCHLYEQLWCEWLSVKRMVIRTVLPSECLRNNHFPSTWSWF